MLRSFAKAKTFIYIDPAKMEESKNWLLGKQKENGCFQQSGKLFNNRMKVIGSDEPPSDPALVAGDADGLNGASSPQGGVSDEVTLSAYITAAFLEMGTSATVSPKAEAKKSGRKDGKTGRILHDKGR